MHQQCNEIFWLKKSSICLPFRCTMLRDYRPRAYKKGETLMCTNLSISSLLTFAHRQLSSPTAPVVSTWNLIRLFLASHDIVSIAKLKYQIRIRHFHWKCKHKTAASKKFIERKIKLNWTQSGRSYVFVCVGVRLRVALGGREKSIATELVPSHPTNSIRHGSHVPKGFVVFVFCSLTLFRLQR